MQMSTKSCLHFQLPSLNVYYEPMLSTLQKSAVFAPSQEVMSPQTVKGYVKMVATDKKEFIK